MSATERCWIYRHDGQLHLLRLKESYGQKVLIPKAGGRIVIIGKTGDRKRETRTLSNAGGRVQGISSSPTDRGHAPFWLRFGVRISLFCSKEGKAKLCKMIKTEEEGLPRECDFFGHVIVQNTSDGCKRNYGPWHHLYLIPDNVVLKDAVAFSYGHWTQRAVQSKQKILPRDADPLFISDEKASAHDNAFTKTVGGEKTEQGDKNSAIDLLPDYLIHLTVEGDQKRAWTIL